MSCRARCTCGEGRSPCRQQRGRSPSPLQRILPWQKQQIKRVHSATLSHPSFLPPPLSASTRVPWPSWPAKRPAPTGWPSSATAPAKPIGRRTLSTRHAALAMRYAPPGGPDLAVKDSSVAGLLLPPCGGCASPAKLVWNVNLHSVRLLPCNGDPEAQEFLAYFNTTVERETAAAALAPYPQLYTASVLATVHEHGFCEGALLQPRGPLTVLPGRGRCAARWRSCAASAVHPRRSRTSCLAAAAACRPRGGAALLRCLPGGRQGAASARRAAAAVGPPGTAGSCRRLAGS